jgi:hypothetical protein
VDGLGQDETLLLVGAVAPAPTVSRTRSGLVNVTCAIIASG